MYGEKTVFLTSLYFLRIYFKCSLLVLPFLYDIWKSIYCCSPQVLDYQLAENVPYPVTIDDLQDIAGIDESVVGESEDKCSLQALDGQQFYDLVHGESSACVVKNEHMAQPNDMNNEAPIDLLDELFSGNAPPEDGLFLDTLDFLGPAQEPHDFDLLGSYLDDDIDIGPYLNFDSPLEVTDNDADQVFSTKQVTMLLKIVF